MQRHHRNHGGYFGETIDLDAVLRDCRSAADQLGWRSEDIVTASGLCLPVFHLPAPEGAPEARRHVYISTGIHGDEPAGPLAAVQLLREPAWFAGVSVWLLPCLNPTGFLRNTRESAAGKDLNRDYRHLESPEIRAHVAWLERQPAFDLALCLHEDWEAHGFYLYELNPDARPSLAKRMVERVAKVCPIDLSEIIEGRAARGGIIRPALSPADRPQWPEAFYLIQHKTRLSYTLEAPSDYSLAGRVAALVAGVRAGLAGMARAD